MHKTLLNILVMTLIQALVVINTAWAGGFCGPHYQVLRNNYLSPRMQIAKALAQQSYLKFYKNFGAQDAAATEINAQELQACGFVKTLMRQIEQIGEDVSDCRRYEHVFKVIKDGEETGSFTSDCSGLLGTASSDYYPARNQHDKNNYYFRAGNMVVVNSAYAWLVNITRTMLAPNVPILFVPMLSKRIDIPGLTKDREFQAWTAAQLLAMEILGKDTFEKKTVAIMGVGNGVDAIRAFLLGANKVHLFELEARAKKLFQQTLRVNNIQGNRTFNYNYIGTNFDNLPTDANVKTDVILINLGRFGTQVLPKFSRFFIPRSETITLVLTGDMFATLWPYQKERINALKEMQQDGFQITWEREGAQDEQIIAYVMKFDRKQWKAAAEYLSKSEEEFLNTNDSLEIEEGDGARPENFQTTAILSQETSSLGATKEILIEQAI
jgi:hypothetical protein